MRLLTLYHRAMKCTGACLEIVRGGGQTLFFGKSTYVRGLFFRLSPISNVKFGVLRGGGMAQWPPPLNTPLHRAINI